MKTLISFCLIFLFIRAIQFDENQTSQEDILQTECIKCHTTDKKSSGPTFKEISKKYKSKSQAKEFLYTKIKNGGKGNWPEIARGAPMPPYSGRISEAEINKIANWIMSL